MAFTEFGASDPQTRKVWSTTTFVEAILQTRFRSFMGTGENAIIQRLTELEKGAGDQIKFDLLLKMKGYGVDGDERAKGKGEALVYKQDTIDIDQKRLVHEFKRMSQQRTVHDLRSSARDNLRDRWAVILDEFMFAYAAGIAYGDLLAALPFASNTLRVPDAGHLITDTSNTFSTKHIDWAKEKARTAIPPVRTPMFQGRKIYVLLINPYQETSLKRSADAGGIAGLRTVQQYAGERGANNPIFRGAMGVWNDVIIHSSDYMPTLIHATAASSRSHAVLFGAQAMVVAFGNAFPASQQARMGRDNLLNWAEEVDDYGNEQGVAAGIVFGISKPQFTIAGVATDHAVVRITTNENPLAA